MLSRKEPSHVRELRPLEANGQHFDSLPGHDDREFFLSTVNAADVLDALSVDDFFSERPSGRSTSLGRSAPSPSASASARFLRNGEAGDDAHDRSRDLKAASRNSQSSPIS
jgi:hypothetical protein